MPGQIWANKGQTKMKKANQTWGKRSTTRLLGTSSIALIIAGVSVTPATSAIDNSAIASGTYDDGTNPPVTVDSPPDTASVPVLVNRNLSIVKSVQTAPSTNLGSDPTNTDAGDTVVYRYVITNNGSVTENNVTVSDVGPTFDGVAGVGTFTSGPTEVTVGGTTTGVASALAPGEVVVFDATYEFANLDILRAAGVTDGVSNIATASSDDIPNSPPSPPALASIPAVPQLAIVKAAVLNELVGNTGDGLAEAGDTITYTYTVTNNGNVPLTNVSIQDTHEGTLLTGADLPRGETITTEGPVQPSDIGTVNDGVITTFEAGAIATFTVTLTVTQQEVDNG